MQGLDLIQAEPYLATREKDFEPPDADYIRLSIRARDEATEAAQRLWRRVQWGIGTSFVTVSVIALAAIAFFVESRDANQKLTMQTSQLEQSIRASRLQISADTLFERGNLNEAFESITEATKIFRSIAAQAPEVNIWWRDLSASLSKVGDIRYAQGDMQAAIENYRETLAIRDKLAKDDPTRPEWQRDLSISYDRIADVFLAAGDRTAALENYRKSLAIRDKLVKDDPTHPEWQHGLSVSHNKIADVLLAAGDRTAALENYHKSLAITEKLVKDDDRVVQYLTDLIVSHYKLAKAGDAPRENLQKALGIAKKLEADGKLTEQLQGEVRLLEGALTALDALAAQAAFEAGDYANAAKLRKEVVEAIEKRATKQARNPWAEMVTALGKTAFLNGIISGVDALSAFSGKPGAETVGALGNYAFYAVFARQFDEALAASDRALALDPDQLWIATNRAHALMFLGRAEAARAAFLEHKGKPIPNNENKPWEQVILEDFAAFEQGGLTHPQMAEIKALLSAPQ